MVTSLDSYKMFHPTNCVYRWQPHFTLTRSSTLQTVSMDGNLIPPYKLCLGTVTSLYSQKKFHFFSRTTLPVSLIVQCNPNVSFEYSWEIALSFQWAVLHRTPFWLQCIYVCVFASCIGHWHECFCLRILWFAFLVCFYKQLLLPLQSLHYIVSILFIQVLLLLQSSHYH